MKDLWRLLRLFRPYAGWIALGILLSLATLIANIALMAVSGWFVASMAIAGTAGVSMNYFTPAAIIRACAIVRTGGRYGERLVTHEATLRLLSGLRVWLYEHLEPLAPSGLQRYRSGDLLSRIRADIDTLDNFYLRVLAPTVTAVLGGLACGLFLLADDSRLALILAAFLVLAGIGLPWLVRILGDASGRRVVSLKSDVRAATVDGVQGLAELQAYGAAGAQAAKIAGLSRQLAREQQRLSGITGLSQGALAMSANLAMWLIVWTAIPLVRDGAIAPPELAMLALYTLAAFEAVMPLPAAFQALGETQAAARRILEIADAESQVKEPKNPAALPQGFGITLTGVHFTYPEADRPALAGIDLDFPEGKKVALIGPTGSGKTTLVNLLLRFWAPERGHITLGGDDIAKLRGEDVRRCIAVVSQHTHLFTGTIRDNLRLAKPEASQDELEQACRAAELHDFILAQPDGYETQVGEAGLALSGGQARRLTTARALLKDAPILVLDEPTEGLDNPTAKALMRTLATLMTERSVLLVTHRAEGLADMDEILVLERGRITARGDHRHLLDSLPAYRVPN
ncbi:MAG: thiol reductant ABC exporter subunit CydC [Chromatiaceae bacterium]|nr:thiol reductant ABC exporter subunit CydC [Chromatiaceae bacterium]